MDTNIRALSGDASVTARVACTDNVRLEFLRCRSEAILRWRIPRAHVGPQQSEWNAHHDGRQRGQQ